MYIVGSTRYRWLEVIRADFIQVIHGERVKQSETKLRQIKIVSVRHNLSKLPYCMSCPCCISQYMLDTLHFHVHAASPCAFCMFMPMLHIHFHTEYPFPCSTVPVHSACPIVHVSATCPCPCCLFNCLCPSSMHMSMSMLHVHVHPACPVVHIE
jgi:hypothetical protein